MEGGSSDKFARNLANQDLVEYCKLHNIDYSNAIKVAKDKLDDMLMGMS
jgi:hypothetical protein